MKQSKQKQQNLNKKLQKQSNKIYKETLPKELRGLHNIFESSPSYIDKSDKELLEKYNL